MVLILNFVLLYIDPVLAGYVVFLGNLDNIFTGCHIFKGIAADVAAGEGMCVNYNSILHSLMVVVSLGSPNVVTVPLMAVPPDSAAGIRKYSVTACCA